jgi:phage tail sheath protein FI
MLIEDPDPHWAADASQAVDAAIGGRDELDPSRPDARNAALYFPALLEADPLGGDRVMVFAPSGAVAGVYARTDQTRGVWKAPAGLEAGLAGVDGLQVELDDRASQELNPRGINALRSFPARGCVVWGARTLRGADQLADEYKYVPVRRLALYIEESLDRGTKWAAFEPNQEPLWAQLRASVGNFMHDLFRQGAFPGVRPDEAYFVRCGAETMSQDDIDRGTVNIRVGFAPRKPAEFVLLDLQQLAGRTQG